MCDIVASDPTDLVICAHCQYRKTCRLLPATGGRKGMEGGEGKHLSSVRHLLLQMTQSDCRESLMERSPFTITVAPVDSLLFSFPFSFLSVSVRGPADAAWPQTFYQTSLLSTIKSAAATIYTSGTGRGAGEVGWQKAANYPQRQCAVPPRMRSQPCRLPTRPGGAQRRAVRVRAKCCGDADREQAGRQEGRPAVRRQAETGGGRGGRGDVKRRRCNVSGVPVSADLRDAGKAILI